MADTPAPVRIWDLPTRLFHWTLALCVAGLVASGYIGGNAMVWHFRLGYTVAALLAFRILWGVVGGHWSRFARFVYAPATVLRYVRGHAQPHEHLEVGHSPLGAGSVFALLGILALQVATGLFADDEIANTGPLVKFVSSATSGLCTRWHKEFGQRIIIVLVLLHVLAILIYFLRRKNLVLPMLTGNKVLTADVPASLDNARTRTWAAVLFAICAAAVAWLVNLGNP